MEPSTEELTQLREDAEARLDDLVRDVDELRVRLDPHAVAAAGRAEARATVERMSDQAKHRARRVLREHAAEIAIGAVLCAGAVIAVVVAHRRDDH